MSAEEAISKIKELEFKITCSHSNRQKIIYMSNIMTLLSFLKIMYNIDYEKSSIISSKLYEDTIKTLMDENVQFTRDLFELNDLTKKLAMASIRAYQQQKFNPFAIRKTQSINNNLFGELLEAFMASLGNFVYKKYLEMLDGKIMLIEQDNYAGHSWDLPAYNMQLIDLAPNERSIFSTFAHEMGHVIHMQIINDIGLKKIKGNIFCESISTLFEIMFINYVQNCGIDYDWVKRNFYYSFLQRCIVAKAGSHAVRDDNIYEYYGDSYFDSDYFNIVDAGDYSKVFCAKVQYIKYEENLLYFYGTLIAHKILDGANGDNEKSVYDMLDFLKKSEVVPPKEILDDLGLTHLPKSLIRTLRTLK